ncbi:T9SS type B sorting domain-containing protein [Antarcticibacterium sp. 1MA-6-2]|uniref:T9SS type B sorting domain-containing protein n=1 Tax=Antarcticibacterium sp. 1MA-6-2 TaxID=2908210 RepID=UPI001F41FF17|nr:T9SS type B sorting domain-containing protein [Antarcticibacterium sp. 1MA-6-2]UJH91761.1 T9SS type B sorting domain-containing protein [Antarcticibacterium sp. 1MA-6-2]
MPVIHLDNFTELKLSSLCENSSYEFSAYLLNVHDPGSGVCPNGGIPINVRFEIWDETDTNKLKEGSTGTINSSFTPIWKQYALTFQTVAGQNSVILKMFNNGEGGCGNDLAIDDITFRSCGDFTEVLTVSGENSVTICAEDTPQSFTLEATPDFSVYTQHFFQWQESLQNEIWTDIPGKTDAVFVTPQLSSSKYYRVKVAEAEVNLANNLCSSVSEAFFAEVIETPNPPVSSGDVVICGNAEISSLRVNVSSGEVVNWYDAASGGNLLSAGTSSFLPTEEGTYYAEAVKNSSCEPSSRTAVTLTINSVPEVEDEILQLCSEGSLELNAGVGNMNYLWSTGETSQSINTMVAGNFRVTITTQEGCSISKNFDVVPVEVPVIQQVRSEGSTVIVELENPERFEFSLDGTNFQLSNVFNSVRGGIYTAYVRDLQQCNTLSLQFPHIVVSQFITPNNDGSNDFFELRGVEYFEFSEIRLFDRYGKLLKSGKGVGFRWDGTFNGRPLPAEDYWYEILIEGFRNIKGHFSLVR